MSIKFKITLQIITLIVLTYSHSLTSSSIFAFRIPASRSEKMILLCKAQTCTYQFKVEVTEFDEDLPIIDTISRLSDVSLQIISTKFPELRTDGIYQLTHPGNFSTNYLACPFTELYNPQTTNPTINTLLSSEPCSNSLELTQLSTSTTSKAVDEIKNNWLTKNQSMQSERNLATQTKVASTISGGVILGFWPFIFLLFTKRTSKQLVVLCTLGLISQYVYSIFGLITFSSRYNDATWWSINFTGQLLKVVTLLEISIIIIVIIKYLLSKFKNHI